MFPIVIDCCGMFLYSCIVQYFKPAKAFSLNSSFLVYILSIFAYIFKIIVLRLIFHGSRICNLKTTKNDKKKIGIQNDYIDLFSFCKRMELFFKIV